MPCRVFSLVSGGLDSRLAVKVLQRAGAYVEGIAFSTPFFPPDEAIKAASQLGIALRIVDFLDDEIRLLENPPHGFGRAMNPCIDCHATMIMRAGEIMREERFDLVATGEVLGQRPMSQNAQALGIVGRSSGIEGRLLRPLSARLLAPTIPEEEGLIDRERLLDIQGRGRERQLALAKEFGIEEFPSPAGGCRLTEEAFGRKLRDLKEHEGLGDRRKVELITVARRFRLEDGTSVLLGRDKYENDILSENASLGVLFSCKKAKGPSALVWELRSEQSAVEVASLIAAYSKPLNGEEDISVTVSNMQGPIVIHPPFDRGKFKRFMVT